MRKRDGILGLGTLLSIIGAVSSGTAFAQSFAQALPECQPPRADEYLLLVPNQRPEIQAQLQQLLPANAVLTPCNYLNTNVIRVEGFASADIATAWAQYLQDASNVLAYVARPAAPGSIANAPVPNAVGGTSSPVPNAASANRNSVANPDSAATSTSPAFNPQPLGAGYAVVVNYFNRPEIAANVRQVTSRDVGLVAYEQQPYLLAAFTNDAAFASTMLRTLSDQGLTAAIVDSRRAVLLTPSVKGGN